MPGVAQASGAAARERSSAAGPALRPHRLRARSASPRSSVDGALGMALWRAPASSLLLGVGVPPRVDAARRCTRPNASPPAPRRSRTTRSATSTSACSGAAAARHARRGRRRVRRCVNCPAMRSSPGSRATCCCLGLVIIAKGFREIASKRVTSHLIPLGFFGALVDAIGGGGWGPVGRPPTCWRAATRRVSRSAPSTRCEFFVDASPRRWCS